MTTTKKRVELLIFDLDGTLVDTRKDLANAVNHALQEIDRKPFTEETIVSFVGDGIKKLLERALETSEEEMLKASLENFRTYYRRHLCVYSKPYLGVKEALKTFSHKKLAVLTNKPHEFSVPLLEQLGINEFFESVIGAQNGFKLKPDPEAIHHLLTSFEIDPEYAVMIGDSQNDILAGREAGIMTCAVTYGYRPREELAALAPDFMIDNLKTLDSVFE